MPGERRRVAGDVDDARRLEPGEPAQGLSGQPRARRVDDDDVRPPGALGEILERRAHLAREERGVRDPVQAGVLDRAGDRLRGCLDAPHGQARPAIASPIVPIPQ